MRIILRALSVGTLRFAKHKHKVGAQGGCSRRVPATGATRLASGPQASPPCLKPAALQTPGYTSTPPALARQRRPYLSIVQPRPATPVAATSQLTHHLRQDPQVEQGDGMLAKGRRAPNEASMSCSPDEDGENMADLIWKTGEDKCRCQRHN